jgi:hypothetical protein
MTNKIQWTDKAIPAKIRLAIAWTDKASLKDMTRPIFQNLVWYPETKQLVGCDGFRFHMLNVGDNHADIEPFLDTETSTVGAYIPNSYQIKNDYPVSIGRYPDMVDYVSKKIHVWWTVTVTRAQLESAMALTDHDTLCFAFSAYGVFLNECMLESQISKGDKDAYEHCYINRKFLKDAISDCKKHGYITLSYGLRDDKWLSPIYRLSYTNRQMEHTAYIMPLNKPDKD